MLLQDLVEKKLMSPPKWLVDNVHYLTTMGSIAYATNLDTSDFDVYGWCIPPKHIVFPHTAGVVLGFGYQGEKFDQYQQHHVNDPDALAGKGREYDFTIFNIVKYFQLVMENNPNCIDSLFVPYDCILHISQIGNMVRENRKLFLHKECFKKYKGYAMSQLHSMNKGQESLIIKQKIKKIKEKNIKEKNQLSENLSLKDIIEELNFRKLKFNG